MRQELLPSIVSHGWLGGLVAIGLIQSACSGPVVEVVRSPAASGRYHVDAPPGWDRQTSGIDPIQKAAQDQAQHLAGALNRVEQSIPMEHRVQWIQTAARKTIGRSDPINLDRRSDEPVASSEHPIVSTSLDSSGQPQRSNLARSRLDPSADPKQLLKQLRHVVRTQPGSPMEKALAAVGLGLADPDHVLASNDLSGLGPARRERVETFFRLMLTLADELLQEQQGSDRDSVLQRVEALFPKGPIRIRAAELCRRVQGYGVYEPFDSPVFLAGREQAMIVYTELDNFNATDIGDRYQVQLTQEVVLYNESDGLAVWRQAPVDIVDESRNQRRDFFVVQMIRLPIRLGVGKYLVKVRITDRADGSLDEATIPIQFVADQAMVTTGGQ